MNRLRLPFDIRGPFGAAGLGLLAGAGALGIIGISSGGNDSNEPGNGGVHAAYPGASAESPDGARPAETLPIPDRPLWDNGPSPEDRPVRDPEPAPLPKDDDGTPMPQGSVTIQQEGGAVLPARADTAEVVFIVRMKGAPEVDIITRNFRRDPAAAQAAWVDLVARLPALGDFELSGASFSGELRLSRRLSSATPAAIQSLQDQLLAIEGVAYADPDYVAHPGKGDTP